MERAAIGLLLLAAGVVRARGLAEPLDLAGADRAAGALLAVHGASDQDLTPGVRFATRLAYEWASSGEFASRPRFARGVLLLDVWALVAHLTAAGALAWILRLTHGSAAALFGLALWGTQPIAVLHGCLWGVENLGLACGLVAAGCGLRWTLDDRRAWLPGVVLAGGLGALCGWTCGALLLAVAVGQLGRPRAARLLAAAAVIAALTAWLQLPVRDAAPWLGSVGGAPLEAFGLVALLVAMAGVALQFARLASRGARDRLDRFAVGPAARADLVLPLAVGGALARLLEADSSWVLLTPALAAAGAAFFVQVSRPLLGLRAGLAPVVVAVGLVAFPGLAGHAHLRAALDQQAPRGADGARRPSLEILR